MQQGIQVSQLHIIQAFKAISNPLTPPQHIGAANQYLNNCQKSPNFALTLINLYSTSPQPFIQLQSILLFLNLIKRNWQSKRGRARQQQIQSFQTEKVALRAKLIEIYPLYNLAYVKHMNQILKFLARQDYPTKYPQLHRFMLSSLESLLKDVLISAQSIKQNKHLIVGLLSTVKIVTKEYASKRLSHSQQAFNQYISEVIKVSFPISERCHQSINTLLQEKKQGINVDLDVLQTLLESGKKVDKIILYCLLCMPNNLQYVSEVQKIFQVVLGNVSQLDSYLSENLVSKDDDARLWIQSYISGVLQQVYKVQSVYPFLLLQCLQSYLHLILKMLIKNITNKCYKSQRIILTIVQANLKIFTCFTYYMSQQEFSGSIYNRKSTNNLQLQLKCYTQFTNVFTQENVTQLLSKLITQVMVSKSVNPHEKDIIDQEMILEQSEVGVQDALVDSNAYELCILLCKNIIRCFKKQLKPVLQSLFASVGSFQATNNAIKQKVIENTMQVILILPKIYDEHQLPLQKVMNLLQVLYQNQQYSMLARLIKNYHQYLNHSTLQNSFNVLSQIVSTPLTNPYITVDIIYQSALTMKKILTQNQSDIFSFENFSNCVINLLSLLQNQKFTKNPTLMWPLIKLSNQLLKLTNTNIIMDGMGEKIIECISPVLESRNSEQLTVCGMSQTLQNLLSIICGCFKNNYLSEQLNNVVINKATIKVLYAGYSLIVNNVDNKNLQNVDSLYLLWLSLMRHYPTVQQQNQFLLNSLPQMSTLNSSLREMFGHLFETVLQEDSICAIQILEEYIIVGLVELNETQLLGIFEKILSNCLQQHKVRAYTALFSMYYCYLIVQNENGKNPLQTDILKLLLSTLKKYYIDISPQINGLRTLIMIIINYCVIKFGVENIYTLFNSFHNNNYAEWFYVYCWSAQFVSNKLAHKINSTAYLKALQELTPSVFGKMLQTPIDQQYPLDIVLKTMVITLEPIKITQSYTTLSNMYKLILPTQTTNTNNGTTTSRKIKLQLSGFIKQILINDQRDNYQRLMSELFKFWDWGEDDIVQRFDKITSNEIIMLIKGTYQLSKGNYKKDYDINQPD